MSSLVDLYRNASSQYPEGVGFYSMPPDFSHHLTWKEIWNRSVAVAKLLKENGVQPGYRIGIMANSSWRWEIAQLAGFLCRAVVVGIDPMESEKNLALISSKAQIQFLFYEHAHWLEKWKRATEKQISYFDMTLIPQILGDNELSNWKQTLPEESEPAVIIFTSGTTSEPKGILYTHQEVQFAIDNVLRLYPQELKLGRTICWLPLANLFQRITNFCTVRILGSIYFVENPVEIGACLSLAQPTVFASVPRFYEKIHDGIQTKLLKLGWPVRIFLTLGLGLAALHWRASRKFKWLPRRQLLLAPWEYLFFRKLRMVFGGRIKFLVSGSAPLRLDLAIFFHSVGLPILEAYGTSENTIPIAANTLNDFKLGSVGRPVVPGSVKISSEGEILVKNPGLFHGYIGVDSKDAFIDGYYKTGDIGRIDNDGFVFLHGRRTSMFKTTTGKKVQVEEIENHFKKIPFIDQVVVLGQGRKLPLVLVTLDLAALSHYQQVNVADLWDREQGELGAYHQAKIENQVLLAWKSLDVSVKPAGALILPRRFSLDRQEITPNLKLRVKIIEARYQAQLDQLYIMVDEDPSFHVIFVREDGLKKQKSTQPTALAISDRWKAVLQMIWQIWKVELQHRLGFKSSKQVSRKFGQILRNGLGTLKGPLQKVGQILSYVSEDLPPEFREELSVLLQGGAPINSQIIKTMVEDELHKPIPSIFCEWRDEPIASASIGQVHWARLVTGEEVAVKVLNPGIEKMLESDMRVLRWVLPLIKRVVNFHSILPHFAELKELLAAECDLTNEAKNLSVFRRLFKGDKDILIPKVYSQFSSKKVLVMEFIHGKSFHEFINSADAESKKRAIRAIWTFSAKSVNLYALFNADPHPGNYLFTPDKVAIIDFGFCKHWKSEFIRLWKKQVLAGMANDLPAFEEASRAVGVINEKDPDFYRKLLETYQRIIFLPWLKDAPFHFTHEFVKEYLRTLLEAQISVRGLKLPREFLALSRLYWGKFVLMAELDATDNFYQMTIPYVKEELHPLPEAV